MQIYDSATQEAKKVEAEVKPVEIKTVVVPVVNDLLQKIQIGLQLVSIAALVIILLK